MKSEHTKIRISMAREDFTIKAGLAESKVGSHWRSAQDSSFFPRTSPFALPPSLVLAKKSAHREIRVASLAPARLALWAALCTGYPERPRRSVFPGLMRRFAPFDFSFAVFASFAVS